METRNSQSSRPSVLSRAIRHGFAAATHLPAKVFGSCLGTIVCVETDKPAAALTFDDGPHPRFTPRLLEVLDSYGAKGTFFCVGRHAEENPEIVKLARNSGHCIGNHTHDHVSVRMINSRQRRQQFRRCSDALGMDGPRLFRPPYGHQCLASHYDAYRQGYQVIGWDMSAGDWMDKPAEWMADRMLSRLTKGSIVLLHDRIFSAIDVKCFDRAPMIEAVRIVLERLSPGFRFVTVPELLRLGKPGKANWYCEADAEWLHSLRGEHGERREYSRSSRIGWIDLPGGSENNGLPCEAAGGDEDHPDIAESNVASKRSAAATG